VTAYFSEGIEGGTPALHLPKMQALHLGIDVVYLQHTA
jgi:hypothetical protein